MPKKPLSEKSLSDSLIILSFKFIFLDLVTDGKNMEIPGQLYLIFVRYRPTGRFVVFLLSPSSNVNDNKVRFVLMIIRVNMTSQFVSTEEMLNQRFKSWTISYP